MIIDVWADVVCPWCYIGRRRLQKALAEFPHREAVEVRHRAFQLQPDIEGVELTSTYLAKKYRTTPQEVDVMQARVTQIAQQEGLHYQLDKTYSGNTSNAHRLLLMAAHGGRQDELLQAMFHAYFEEGKPLFTDSDLLALTDEVGIDRQSAHQVLSSDQFLQEVREDARVAQSLGASGVPFFVFDMKFGISGAQPLESFTQTLEAAWRESA